MPRPKNKPRRRPARRPKKRRPVLPITEDHLKIFAAMASGEALDLDDVPPEEFKPAVLAILNSSETTTGGKPFTDDCDDRVYAFLFKQIVRLDFQPTAIKRRTTDYLEHIVKTSTPTPETPTSTPETPTTKDTTKNDD